VTYLVSLTASAEGELDALPAAVVARIVPPAGKSGVDTTATGLQEIDGRWKRMAHPHWKLPGRIRN
jgi:hypothetical protein